MNREAKALELLNRIIEIKTEVDVSQGKMAEKIGVSIFTLNRWFNHGLARVNTGSIMLLQNFIEKYDEAKKSGKLGEFFPFP